MTETISSPQKVSSSKKYYIDEADSLFSQLIRSIGVCQKCSTGGDDLQCAHVFGRDNFRLRWDANNAVCLHHFCHNEWAHKHPAEFIEWFSSKFPDRYRYLLANNNDIWQVREEDLVELCSYFRQLIGERKKLPNITRTISSFTPSRLC